jgi:hypothetical protein
MGGGMQPDTHTPAQPQQPQRQPLRLRPKAGIHQRRFQCGGHGVWPGHMRQRQHPRQATTRGGEGRDNMHARAQVERVQ